MKRALILGAQIEGLKGVVNDTAAMTQLLAKQLGFDDIVERVDAQVDAQPGRNVASRAGILAGYEDLIQRTGAGDTVVIYFSGHGFYGTLAGSPRTWQSIVPTDIRLGSAADFRGITAWELSVLHHRLTRKTPNLTVILDCCHASQMSRDDAARDAIPRALPHPVKVGFEAHIAALRQQYGAAFDAVEPAGNPSAVRLVACGEAESAFEYETAAGRRGVFTEALIDVLREVGTADVSWAAVGAAVRARVLRSFRTQRPDIEGPVERAPFSTRTAASGEVTTLRAAGDRFELPGGRLTGIVVRDIYSVMPASSTSHDPSKAIAELEIDETRELVALGRVRTWSNGHQSVPGDAVAIPIAKNVVKRAVKLVVPAEVRPEIAKALDGAKTVREAEDGETAMATLRLVDGQLTVERGAPVFAPARYPAELPGVIQRIKDLAVAEALRELIGEHGVYRNEVDLEIGVVDSGVQRPFRQVQAALGLRDRYYIQVTSRSPRQLFVHIFNIGLQGTVRLLTKHIAPSGNSIQRGDPPLVFGQSFDHRLVGREILWPKDLPRDGIPRPDEYFVVITSSRVNLSVLETQAHVPGETQRAPGTKLQDLLAQLHDGLSRDDGDGEPMEGFYVERLAFLLHPRDAALGGVAYEIDEDPSGQALARAADAWQARTSDAVTPDVPRAIAIRIADLVVNHNRALFATDVRVDALICTRGADGQPGHATWTQKFARIRDGQRLPLDNGLLYHGAVRDFVELTLFVSRDTDDSLALARLFEQRATSSEFQDAASALLVVAGAVAAPWVAAVGASAALARMAYELLLSASGTSIGLYRTSFLRSEQFGVGRHPAGSLYQAQGFSFALTIESVELTA